ncbi:MAG: DUF4314 domain-containing protein [Actinobacteria bacterium]|nr:MAG: DUF4314 domain-containing protein [Actinomycetota bacterium]
MERVKRKAVPADTEYVDVRGSRLLAARIRAGVRVGARIELVSVGDESCGLQVGDCGVVREIADDGQVTVSWDRGFALEIDPEVNQYRRLAA